MPREKYNFVPQLLTAGQAAKYLGMSRTKFYMEIGKGFIRQHSTPAKNGIPAKRATYWIEDLKKYIEENLALNMAGKIYQSIGQNNTSKM
jgi:hypothetical protein